jgi:CRP-like cAMP-binding protein
MQAVDYLVHFSNVLMLAAYSVRDILWLRWFAVAAALTNIPYFLFQSRVLWPPIVWALVFTAINLYQITRIYLERRPVVLSADEQRLYDLAFRAIRPQEFVSLTLAGEWRDAVAGQKIVAEGAPVTSICIPITGRVDVRRQDRTLATLVPGHLIGTGLALTGEPSPIEAVFTERARYMAWPLQDVRVLLDRRPELRATLQGLVNRDLSRKMERLILER